MPNLQNQKLIERYINDVFLAGKLNLVNELYHPNYKNHTNPPGLPAGPQGVTALLTAFRKAFPDVKAKIHHIVSDGDKVVWHAEASGTHKAELLGIPASGKKATWRAISIDRIQDGKIAERWELFDLHGLLAQISPPHVH